MPPIYDENSNVISPAVQQALARPDVIEIKNRTLDGKYHLQTIGTGGTIVEVVAHFTKAEKLLFDAVKRNSGLLTVNFDGSYYIGFVDGEPSYERLPNADEAMFTISFTLLVESEGVL